MFLDEILGLPPKRDIDFTIELVPRAAPVSKAPYGMSTPEMLELNMQLQELLEKKYIQPSVSPWGAPVLFVKKKVWKLNLGFRTITLTTIANYTCKLLTKKTEYGAEH